MASRDEPSGTVGKCGRLEERGGGGGLLPDRGLQPPLTERLEEIIQMSPGPWKAHRAPLRTV